MSCIIDKLNNEPGDVQNWYLTNKEIGKYVKSFSKHEEGINISLSDLKKLVNELFYYERELCRFDVLVLLLKERDIVTYKNLGGDVKELFSGTLDYWSEVVAKETIVFGVSKGGIKLYSKFYQCDEDVDYIVKYEKELAVK